MGDVGSQRGFGCYARVVILGAGCLALANCSSGVGSKYGVASKRVVPIGERAPKGGGVYKVGNPYTIAGQTFVPKSDPTNYHAVGYASWYGDDFHGRYTANGEIFDEQSISAASPVLPMPSYARVTNLANHRSIVVRINDRGPYARNRVIDLSRKTAKLLGFYGDGIAKVKVDYVGRAPLSGSSDRELIATLRDHGEAKPVRVALADRDSETYFDSRPMREMGPRGRNSNANAQGERRTAQAEPASAHVQTTELAANARSDLMDDFKHVPPPVGDSAPSPVSAFASARYDVRASGFISGRGLY